MARSRTNNSSRRGNGKSSSSSFKWILLLLLFVIIGLVGWLIVKIIGGGGDDYVFSRRDLDKYVEITHQTNLLNDGASVYFDMSNGMINAYRADADKSTLQSVINKLAANDAIKFFRLASGKITSLEMSHTDLYNYMLSNNSYGQQQAPIETTLDSIVKKKQPALLMTDFEEYHSGVIQRAAYAKKYFIDWLSMGYNITFYKWGFVEGGINKYMFLAVFDDNANRLNSLIEEAVSTNSNIETFVLGSRDFAYPTMTQYPSSKQGGNYHNSKGKDIVTAVLEGGGAYDYVCYAKTIASANGKVGQFAPLSHLVGPFAEYYPIGVTWQDAIKNSQMMQQNGIREEDRFYHVLSELYVNFEAQDGYDINQIEIRTFDMQETMRTIASSTYDELNNIDIHEINEIFVANMEERPCPNLPEFGWKHIFVDFHDKFNGTFIGGKNSSNLLRANVVISNFSPNIEEAELFFKWDNNPSLANSVKEALQASTSKPSGRILYTYYIKTLAN